MSELSFFNSPLSCRGEVTDECWDRYAPAAHAEYERVAAALEARQEPHRVFRASIWAVHVLESRTAGQSDLPDGRSYRALLISPICLKDIY